MAKIRREKTLADYVAIAFSPMLIMTLVGSLAFFLLAIVYKGQFEGRVQWVLFWFVSGAVLVARIAIEQGKEHANLFGWGLAGVTGLFCYRFLEQDAVVIAWALLAVIWWCSWKLTWDCTLIDDGDDSSGEGLIEAAGLVRSKESDPAPTTTAAAADRSLHADTGAEVGERIPLWRKIFSDPSNRTGRPHAPGLWVVYFSLAALPLFGIGQLFIPAAEAGRRSYAFILLAIYVASALGLLLTTSFLGLRRYLRQRKLQMPAAMTATWLGMGTALAAVLLFLALLIPRPQGEYTITEWINKADEKAREASRLAMLRDNHGEGEGRRIGEHDPKAVQPGERPPPDQKNAANPAQQPGQQQGAEQQPGQPGGDKPQNDPAGRNGQNPGQSGDKSDRSGNQQQAQSDGKRKQSDQNERDGKKDDDGKNDANRADRNRQNNQQAGNQEKPQGNQNPQRANANERRDGERRPGEQRQPQNANPGNQSKSPSPPNTPSGSWMTNILTTVAPFVKWILYGLLGAVVVYFVLRHWGSFVATLMKLWNELLSLLGLGPRAERGNGSEIAEPAPAPQRPFAAFNDPFLTGDARRMSPAQLVRYTFDALEAWSREQGLPRPPEQTPLEFAAELGRRIPAASKDVSQTAQIYVQVAYARGNPSRDSLEVLERLWRRMNVMAGA
ncbi:MAG: DUF4129 domain-containing protein [Planctomycetia bacterium]|nr:DUF4129 domain-containing protein [Planctomycetia bacterium]